MRKRQLLTMGGILCLVSTGAHAYVDPGTGSMAIQLLVGGVLAAVFMVKTYYYELKRKITSLFSRNSSADANSTATETDSENSTASTPPAETE
ncbi:MAG: hypothetical protein ACR2P6_01180 [Gammaproteobacteria bacterium]